MTAPVPPLPRHPAPYPPTTSRAAAHPSAAPALVLGLVGLAGSVVVLPLAVSPLAWYLGARARRESQREPERWPRDGGATAGLVLGIVGTVVLVGLTLVLLGVLGLMSIGVSQDTGYGT